jgi:hypothetical protein
LASDGIAVRKRHPRGKSRRRSYQQLCRADDQLFFREKLESAVAIHVHRVTEVAVRRGKHRNDDAVLTVVARLFNPFANYKFRHRPFLSGILSVILPQTG